MHFKQRFLKGVLVGAGGGGGGGGWKMAAKVVF